MINKSVKLLLVLSLVFSAQVFAEDVASSTQLQSTEKAKHKLNTRAIYHNANISQNGDGEWVYSSKGRGTYDTQCMFASDCTKKIYLQDEFKIPNVFYPKVSNFTIEEMKGSHIPKSNLKVIEDYLQGLVEQCEIIYDFDNSFYSEYSVNDPFIKITPICNDDKSLCISELAQRIQRCVPYYRLKVQPYARFSEEGNPLRIEYLNLEESYLLLKQYEIIYLTLRANQLMGKYSKLMPPMTLLQEYARETGFYEYVQQQKPKKRWDFENTSYEDYAEIYFKGREAWQNGFAEFLDKKTNELSILERDYNVNPLDFNQLRDEFKTIYPKRYIPQSRKFNPSWTHTHQQDEMKVRGGLGILGGDNNLGIHTRLRLNNFTYAELTGSHLSTEAYQKVSRLLEPLLNQCIGQNKLKTVPLNFNSEYSHTTYYDQKLYPLLLECIKDVAHYNYVLANNRLFGKYDIWMGGDANLKGAHFLFRLYRSQAHQGVIIDHTLLQQGAVVETELYPKIYLIIRHYRLLRRFPNAPIPTKLMDEYLEVNNIAINRDSYDDVMAHLFDHQDDFAEFLDNKFNQLIKEK